MSSHNLSSCDTLSAGMELDDEKLSLDDTYGLLDDQVYNKIGSNGGYRLKYLWLPLIFNSIALLVNAVLFVAITSKFPNHQDTVVRLKTHGMFER